VASVDKKLSGHLSKPIGEAGNQDSGHRDPLHNIDTGTPREPPAGMAKNAACQQPRATRRPRRPDRLSFVPRSRSRRGLGQLMGPGPPLVIPAIHARF
jgi:hypothetical protein